MSLVKFRQGLSIFHFKRGFFFFKKCGIVILRLLRQYF